MRPILVLLGLLAFFSAPAFGEHGNSTVEVPTAESLDFDEPALLALSQAGTMEAMVERIRKDYGVVVLHLPEHDQKQNGENSGTEWMYHHFEGKHRQQAYFLGAYLPLVDDRPEGHVLPYWKRPHGDQDLIALRPDSTVGVLLHEFTHFLIEKRRREKSGNSPKDSAQARLERIIGVGPEPTDLEVAQRHVHNRVLALQEEMRVNQYLLGNRRKLNLDLADAQYLLRAMRTDIPTYLEEQPKDHLKDLSDPDRRTLEARLREFAADFTAKNEAFLEEHKQLKTLAGLNARGIHLVPPDFTTVVPQRVLGIHASGELSVDDINAVYRYWAPSYHPDRNPDGKKQFQSLSNAADALKDPHVLMEQMAEEWGSSLRTQWQTDLARQRAEGDRALRQAKRFIIRFATQCGVTAAACAIDHWVGGEMSVMMRGWPFWLLNGAAAMMGRAENPQRPDPVKDANREGLRSGMIRGGILAGCVKVLEMLAR